MLNHELRTPLNADVLDGSRIISGKMRLETKACDLTEVVRSRMEELESAG